MNTYQRIRDLREDAELTQKQISDKLSMHLTQYRRYECGESDLPLSVAIKIARFYDVSIDYIAGLTNEKRGLTKSSLNETETLLINGFRKLDSISQGRILERIEILRK